MGLTLEQIDKIENMVNKLYSNIGKMGRLGNIAPKEFEVTKEIYRSLYGKELPSANNMTDKDRAIIEASGRMIKEYRRFYKGLGDYSGNGYKEKIIDPVNKQLKDGVQLQYSVEDPGDIKSTRYKEVRDFSVKNMKYMLPVEAEYRQGKGTEWNQTKLAILNNIMSDESTTINYLYNTEGDALIRLWNPNGQDGKPVKGGTTLTLRVDPVRSDDTNGIMNFYARDTGDPRFLSQSLSSIDLAPNKTYGINDADGYLKSTIEDTKMFTENELNILEQHDIKISKVKEGNGIYYTVEGLTPEPVPVENKMTLVAALKQYVSQNK
jgi:hypothetical protein